MQRIFKDCERYKENPKLFTIFTTALLNSGFRAVMIYRTGNWCRRKGLSVCVAILERIMHHMCFCWVSTAAEIGEGFKIAHPIGLIISGGTVIGNNCDVRQNTTFGGNFRRTDETGRQHPVMGDNVSVGVGSVVIGPVEIGNNVIIGANSVVTRNVPDDVIVAGNPAVVVKKRWDSSSGRGL